ncbi:Platelet-activating factor acetylhydrolase [Escovopsis weberi]|uniref:1-alkyl-2-acetylglycerophosphocholine esterase n=1 Tax=Escovopsis weberi TaxID=150374 RepID=A0A0M9VXQ7_ESCWE|nr:Platelet-activating factor acetylhydrolase [Escovopsis weberi]
MRLCHALLVPLASAALLVPGPFGPYDVSMKVQALADTSRRDPLDPTGLSPARRLLLSVFLPVEKQRRSCPPIMVPYMTDPVAAFYGQQAAEYGISADFYAEFEMQLCDLKKLPACASTKQRKKEYPLILFDPGLAESRLIYGAMARSLASQGYIVVSVDHPFEVPAVEFPDGTIIEGIDVDDTDLSILRNILSIRTADISFVIDQLANKTIMDPLMADFPGTPDFTQLAMWGHSFGGATSASVLHSDSRLRAGLNLDGMLIDPIMNTNITKPFVLAGQLDHTSQDPSWDQFWPHLVGQGMQIGFNHTLHGAFKDILLLLSVVDIPREIREAIQEVLGTINPYQLDSGLNGVLTAFFDLLFRSQTAPLLHLPERFSNVSIVRSNL